MDNWNSSVVQSGESISFSVYLTLAIYIRKWVTIDFRRFCLWPTTQQASLSPSLPVFSPCRCIKKKQTNKTHTTLWDFHWKKADPTEDTRDITPSRKSGGKWRNGLWLSLKTSEASITVFSEPAPIPMASAKQNKKVNDVWIKERLYTSRLTL